MGKGRSGFNGAKDVGNKIEMIRTYVEEEPICPNEEVREIVSDRSKER